MSEKLESGVIMRKKRGEHNNKLRNAPSEIVCNRTWWLNELIIYNLVGCIVDDTDPSQRLTLDSDALKTF
jgi:hypothetical protein